MNYSLMYFLIIAVLDYIFLDINEKLMKKYYTDKAKRNILSAYFFPAVMSSPKKYFKEKNFNKGYGLYLLNILIGLLMIIFFVLLAKG